MKRCKGEREREKKKRKRKREDIFHPSQQFIAMQEEWVIDHYTQKDGYIISLMNVMWCVYK